MAQNLTHRALLTTNSGMTSTHTPKTLKNDAQRFLGADIVKHKRFNGVKMKPPHFCEYMTAYALQGHGLYHYEVKDKTNLIFLAFAIKERKGKKCKTYHTKHYKF